MKFEQNSVCQVPKEKTVFVLAGAIVRIKMRMMFSQSMVIQSLLGTCICCAKSNE